MVMVRESVIIKEETILSLNGWIQLKHEPAMILDFY